MTPTIDTTPLVDDALKAIQNQTGIRAVVERPLQRTLDADITLTRGPKVWHFHVEVKAWLNRTTIELMRREFPGRLDRRMLITRYVAAKQADELRAMNLAFLDTAGNAFINREDLYVFIKGQGAGREFEMRKGDIFRPAELKVLFAFLCLEGLIAKTHEEIKKVTGAGLGTINRLIRGLELAGYILKLKGKDRRLVRRKELLEQWVIAYPQRLRPKQVLGTFQALKEGWWAHMDPAAFGVQWGGEIAAKYLTHYLKPQLATLYAAKQPDGLIVEQRLRRDPKGNVEILKRFWEFPPEGGRQDIVPPLLVYADLLATGDERNTETARMIYEEHLAGLVRED